MIYYKRGRYRIVNASGNIGETYHHFYKLQKRIFFIYWKTITDFSYGFLKQAMDATDKFAKEEKHIYQKIL